MFVRCNSEIVRCFIKQYMTYIKKNLLADWTILLVCYDSKVTSDCPQAGKYLQERNKQLAVGDLRLYITAVITCNASTCFTLNYILQLCTGPSW